MGHKSFTESHSNVKMFLSLLVFTIVYYKYYSVLFTCMHLANLFFQSGLLHWIYTLYQFMHSLGNKPMTLMLLAGWFVDCPHKKKKVFIQISHSFTISNKTSMNFRVIISLSQCCFSQISHRLIHIDSSAFVWSLTTKDYQRLDSCVYCALFSKKPLGGTVVLGPVIAACNIYYTCFKVSEAFEALNMLKNSWNFACTSESKQKIAHVSGR